MLCAIWDYIKYRRRAGRYSDEALAAKGAHLATYENFAAAVDFPPGSVAAVHTRESFVSWLVLYYSNGQFSHLASLVGDGDIVHATLDGVIRESFFDLCDGKSRICVYFPRDLEMGKRAAEIGVSFIGLPYGWGETIKTFVRSVFGVDEGYRVAYFMDFMFLALPFAVLGFWFTWLWWVTAVPLIVYGLIVMINVAWRRAFRHRDGDEGIVPVKT